MRYLLDANASSHIQRNTPSMVAHIAALPRAAGLYTSVVSHGELLYGACHAPELRRSKMLRAIRLLLRSLAGVLPVTDVVAEQYGRLRADLARDGALIPSNDIWVAAIAMEAGLVVVSDDAHFQRAPGLVLENWLR